MLVLGQLSSMQFSRVLCCFTVEKATEMKFDSSKLVLSNTHIELTQPKLCAWKELWGLFSACLASRSEGIWSAIRISRC